MSYKSSPAPEGLWPFSFDAAIFDFDGTLADSADVWNIVDRDFFSARDIEWGPYAANKLASMGFKDSSAWVVEHFGLDETPEQVREEWMAGAKHRFRDSVDLRPGTREYLAALRDAGVPIALATTNTREVLDVMKPRVDVDALFDHIICGDDGLPNKNHPDIYLEAARRMGADPARVVVFEDIPQAIRSAQEAGMVVIGVMSGDPTQAVDDVRKLSDHVLEDWRDIELEAC